MHFMHVREMHQVLLWTINHPINAIKYAHKATCIHPLNIENSYPAYHKQTFSITDLI